MYKEDLALNNIQGSICHKTKPNLKHAYGYSTYTLSIMICLHTFIVIYSNLTKAIPSHLYCFTYSESAQRICTPLHWKLIIIFKSQIFLE